jgi:hypothetical protein
MFLICGFGRLEYVNSRNNLSHRVNEFERAFASVEEEVIMIVRSFTTVASLWLVEKNLPVIVPTQSLWSDAQLAEHSSQTGAFIDLLF